MKQTHISDTQKQTLMRLAELVQAKKQLTKTRINLYVPKAVVKLMDTLSGKSSRGELVTNLILKEVTVKKKQTKPKKLLPYGMFSPLEISETEIDKVRSSWNKTLNEAG